MQYPLLAEVEPSKVAGRSPVYTTARFQNSKLPDREELTLYHTFATAAEKFHDELCIGARTVNANGEPGDYEFWTYGETANKVAKLSTAMKAAGLSKGSKVGIYSVNCREWMIAMQACNRMGYVCVPIYDSLGEHAVEYIVNHSETSIVFVSAANLPKLESALPEVKGFVKTVVYWGTENEQSAEKIKGMKIAVQEFNDWMESTREVSPPEPPTPDDLCTIMYTSGTTGDPKGVMLTHFQIASEVASLKALVAEFIDLGKEDRYISYLPLAHIFDRMGEELMLAIGASIGYWQGQVPKLMDDIASYKPTIMPGVPRIFDRLYSAVTDGVKESNFVKRFLFNYGYSRKSQAIKDGFSSKAASPFFDMLVFSKLKSRIGGNVKLLFSGGAPLASHTEEFMKVCFCAPVMQGYGLTETCAGSFMTYPDDNRFMGTVGPPLPFFQFCLESIPDMNYDANGDPKAGEVLIKGPSVYSGYYKAQSLTDEVLERDGWFHTGDVGQITPDGALKIVDRKKNILKLSQGEYVAVEKIEGAYKEATEIDQIWVYGDSFKNFLVAVVVPSQGFVKKWAASVGKDFDFGQLCRDNELKKAVMDVVVSKAKEKKLKGFEIVKNIYLESEQFSVDNDLITPTFKLKRPALNRKYDSILKQLYEQA